MHALFIMLVLISNALCCAAVAISSSKIALVVHKCSLVTMALLVLLCSRQQQRQQRLRPASAAVPRAAPPSLAHRPQSAAKRSSRWRAAMPWRWTRRQRRPQRPRHHSRKPEPQLGREMPQGRRTRALQGRPARQSGSAAGRLALGPSQNRHQVRTCSTWWISYLSESQISCCSATLMHSGIQQQWASVFTASADFHRTSPESPACAATS